MASLVGPFTALYAAKFFVQAGASNYRFQRELMQIEAQRQNAYRQASINNDLAHVAQLHVNEEDALDLIRTGHEEFELRQSINREKAARAAQEASLGGAFGRSGQSVDDVARNIDRFGLRALVRKDFNRTVRERSFEQRRRNITLETISKNNQIFSGLQIAPSATGRNLEILSAATSAVIDSQQSIRGVQNNFLGGPNV